MHEVEGVKLRDRPKKTWSEVVEKVFVLFSAVDGT